MANERHADDKKILIEVLVTIEKRLHIIVFEADRDADGKSRFRREFTRMLPGPWPEVEHAFLSARNIIEKNQLNWEYVEGIGMTGNMLRWKQALLDESVREGTVGRFLKFANAILGSLTKVVPPLEIVKEYKECVEGAMKYFRG
jgi:hypothetical protein